MDVPSLLGAIPTFEMCLYQKEIIIDARKTILLVISQINYLITKAVPAVALFYLGLRVGNN